ncbi:type III-B CRISPR module-associated protein Cmr5 [Thiofilum flexile]|uniref:type III-B CRISPR module-associated protein Cmr5 n=1 Tax=Thiofilum flexile TaxID=125627 RepID=UPI000361B63D|nr:type III-B CRISPR module-associated protein Cmr5 [Thiofilum flexile]
MQTIQQQRAKYALEKVKSAAFDNPRIGHKEFKSYASNLPAMIHMNGLGQAAAFFKSKGNSSPEHAELYMILSNWLCNRHDNEQTMPQQPYSNYPDLLEGITQADMHTYRLAQAEAQALMDWVKKFAKAFMTEGNVGEGEQP